MAIHTLQKFEALLYATQDKHFQEKRNAAEKVYDKYTKAGPTENADYRSVTSVGLTQMTYTPQSGNVVFDEYEMGPERITTYKKFSTGIIVTEETIDDMRTNKRVFDDKVKLFTAFNTHAAEAATWTIEVLCTDFFTKGTSATATATWVGPGRDALALFSASHVTQKGAVTWSNYQTGAAMTQLAVQEGITMLSNVPTEEGRPQGTVGEVILMYGRFNEWRVDEILGTQKQLDSNYNNINPLGKRKITPVLNPYFSNTFTGWALIDKANHELLHFMKQDCTISRDIHPLNGNRIQRAVMRFARDFDSAKGVLLNPGV